MVFAKIVKKERSDLCHVHRSDKMKKENSSHLLERLEVQAESEIKLAIGVFQNLSADVMLQPSSKVGWSIAQCLEHLNSYGRFYLPHIKSALEKHKHSKPKVFFTSGWLGNYFTNMMSPNSGKHYKAFKNHIPTTTLDPASVVAEFIAQQELLLTYLEEAKKINIGEVKIPVSIAPWVKLKLGDVFQFLMAHNERHIAQAKRNLP